MHGGSIGVRSKSGSDDATGGSGSEFYFTLPYSEDHSIELSAEEFLIELKSAPLPTTEEQHTDGDS